MDVTHFTTNAGGQLVAVGSCTGTLANGTALAGTPCEAPVSSINGRDTATLHGKPHRKLLATCNVLTLTISGLYLNLLGLVVSIPTPVNVLINAVSGAGNLLGNLLCAVTHLMDGSGGGLAGVVALLNQIVTALGL